MYESSGVILYGPGIKVVVNIDEEIARYYRNFIPKYIKYNIPKAKPHITLLRENVEVPNNSYHTKKYNFEKIKFQYDGILNRSDIYIWMNCWSDEIGLIRRDLGLPIFRYGSCYHITLANFKNL